LAIIYNHFFHFLHIFIDYWRGNLKILGLLWTHLIHDELRKEESMCSFFKLKIFCFYSALSRV
jgi:hypothetical protein